MGTNFEALDVGVPMEQLRDAMARVRSGSEEQIDRELEGVDRRGRRILCRVRVTELLDDNEDSHGLVLVFQDITDERRREEYLLHLGRIMGRALNEIYFLDPISLRFMLANEGAERKLGYTSQQLEQISLPDVLVGDRADLRSLLVPLVNGTKAEIVFESRIRAADGREYPAQICMQHFADEHPPILVAIVQETSERQTLSAG